MVGRIIGGCIGKGIAVEAAPKDLRGDVKGEGDDEKEKALGFERYAEEEGKNAGGKYRGEAMCIAADGRALEQGGIVGEKRGEEKV